MCGSRKYPYPPQGWSNLGGGRGVSKAKNFKGKHEGKLEIPGVGGSEPKKHHPWGRYGYFLELLNNNQQFCILTYAIVPAYKMTCNYVTGFSYNVH